MSKGRGPISSLKNWLNASQENQKLTKTHYVIILLVLGVGLMVAGNFFKKDPSLESTAPVSRMEEENTETLGRSQPNQPSTMVDYERYYENQLKDALESVIGVGEVTVVVNVESTEKLVYEKNRIRHSQTTDETDANGGKRKVEDLSVEEQIVLIQEGDKEVPIILETKKPEIKGVLVVAKGADNIQVKKWIVEAVTRVLDVPSHRVSVLAKK